MCEACRVHVCLAVPTHRKKCHKVRFLQKASVAVKLRSSLLRLLAVLMFRVKSFTSYQWRSFHVCCANLRLFLFLLFFLLYQLFALHVVGFCQFRFVLFLVNAERMLYQRPCSQNVLKCLLWQYFKVWESKLYELAVLLELAASLYSGHLVFVASKYVVASVALSYKTGAVYTSMKSCTVTAQRRRRHTLHTVSSIQNTVRAWKRKLFADVFT